jgi:hypothetical protein
MAFLEAASALVGEVFESAMIAAADIAIRLIENNDTQAVVDLVKAKMSIHQKGSCSDTPFMAACLKGDDAWVGE